MGSKDIQGIPTPSFLNEILISNNNKLLPLTPLEVSVQVCLGCWGWGGTQGDSCRDGPCLVLDS